MKDIHLIDSCQTHLPVLYASNIEFIRQSCDCQHKTHVQNRPLVYPIGCPCSHWLLTHQQNCSYDYILKAERFCFLNYKYFLDFTDYRFSGINFTDYRILGLDFTDYRFYRYPTETLFYVTLQFDPNLP